MVNNMSMTSFLITPPTFRQMNLELFLFVPSLSWNLEDTKAEESMLINILKLWMMSLCVVKLLYSLSTCDHIITGVYVGGVFYLSLATWGFVIVLFVHNSLYGHFWKVCVLAVTVNSTLLLLIVTMLLLIVHCYY